MTNAKLLAVRDELLPIVVRGAQRIGELSQQEALNGNGELSARYAGAERYLEILVIVLTVDGFVARQGIEILKIAREFAQNHGSMDRLTVVKGLRSQEARGDGWRALEADGALMRDGGRVWLFAS